MAWTQVIWFIVTTLVSIALAPKPKPPRAAALEDFDFPTAEEGRPIPVVFGTVEISGPNVLWYGQLQVKAIRKRSGFSKQTVGYKYFIAFHLGLCHGPVDEINMIRWGEKVVWTGLVGSNTTIVVDQQGIWGGDKRGGGVNGQFDLMFGAPTQTANAYLTAVQGSQQPGYRGILGAVWRGGYIGTSESVRPIAWTIQRTTSGWNTDVWYPSTCLITTDGFRRHMNPAHICYQIMTDPEWGMGVPSSMINDEIWRDAADLFVDEIFGLDLLWNQQATIEEFLKIVLDHCAAAISLRTSTGQFDLIPIRGDYDPEDLIVLDPSNIKEMMDYQRQGWGETVNEVTLVYTDPDTGKDTAISAHDLGNQEAQGRRIPATVELPGIRIHDIAKQVVQRELAARVTPLGKGQIKVNRRGWRLPYNAVFNLTWPALGISNVAHRVVSINRGTLPNGEIIIDFVEDIYSHELANYLITEPQEPDEDPPAPPVDDPDTGIGVISSTQTEPPTGAADGDSYFVPEGATGEWAGHEGQYADWDEDAGAWVFTDAAEGALIYDAETQTTFQVIEGELVPFGGGGSITLINGETAEEFQNVGDIVVHGGDISEDSAGGIHLLVSPNTTKGDLATRTTTDPARHPVGTEGQYLRARAASTTGLAWENSAPVGEAASGARVYKDNAQSIPNTTLTALTWPVESFDTDSYHSTVTNTSRFTASVAAPYVVGCTVKWDSDTAGTRGIYIVVNGVVGSRRAGSYMPATNGLVQHCSDAIQLAAGDYVEFYVLQDSGTARDIVANEQVTSAFITRVGVTAAPTQMRGASWTRGAGVIALPVANKRVYCPVKGTIRGYVIDGNTTGDCVIDIRKCTDASYPPIPSDSIVGGSPPALVAAQKSVNMTLAGWTTTAVSAGDWLEFVLSSVTGLRDISISVFIQETQ